MIYIPYHNNIDPGFRYEGLARYAFNCERWGGPNNVAHQGVYTSLFVPETSEEGKLVLTQILDSLIDKEGNRDKRNDFIALKESLNNMEQSIAIDLIDLIIKIIRE